MRRLYRGYRDHVRLAIVVIDVLDFYHTIVGGFLTKGAPTNLGNKPRVKRKLQGPYAESV